MMNDRDQVDPELRDIFRSPGDDEIDLSAEVETFTLQKNCSIDGLALLLSAAWRANPETADLTKCAAPRSSAKLARAHADAVRKIFADNLQKGISPEQTIGDWFEEFPECDPAILEELKHIGSEF